MPYTVAEKILHRASGNATARANDFVWVTPDLIIAHDLNYPRYRRMIKEIGFEHLAAPDKTFVTIDHTTNHHDLVTVEEHRFIRADCKSEGVRWFLDIGANGISHNAPLGAGIVKPGMLILASDTRAPALGCAGALSIAVGIGLATTMATDRAWLLIPETVRIKVTGEMGAGVYARDVAQWLAHEIGWERADYRCLEFFGPFVEALSMDGRHTLCNAMVDLGVKAAICVPALRDVPDIMSDKDADYADELSFDISNVEPQVSLPPGPENVVPISTMLETPITTGFIGSCISGKLEDMRAAADVLRGRTVAAGVRLTIIPATQAIYHEALREGLIDIFAQAGATVAAGICGPCYGVYTPLDKADVCISTATRNDPGRMGSTESTVYLSSPAVVAASCVAGRIADPRALS